MKCKQTIQYKVLFLTLHVTFNSKWVIDLDYETSRRQQRRKNCDLGLGKYFFSNDTKSKIYQGNANLKMQTKPPICHYKPTIMATLESLTISNDGGDVEKMEL